MASLTRDDDRPAQPWRVRWRQDGRQRTKRFAKKNEAQRFIGDLARGRRPTEDTRLTVGAWLLGWLAARGHEWEPKTEMERSWTVDHRVIPWIGTRRLTELTRRDIREWRTQLLEVTTVKQANRAVRVLSAGLGAAVEDDILMANPCSGIRPLPTQAPDRRPATISEVERIRAHMPSPADRLQVTLMACGGLRPSEAKAVQWADVSDVQIVVRRGGRATGGTKTGGVRTVKITEPIREDLDAARAEAGDRVTLHAGQSESNWYHRHWVPARKAAGVTGVTPYSLRHTFVSLLIAEGRNVLDVARAVGHTTETLTLTTYGHLFDEAQLRDGEGMEAAVMRARREAHDAH